MLYSYVKLALKVLLRRKFFTAISLFGIALTLTMALIGTALFDHMLAPVAPEVNLGRTLHIGRMHIEMTVGDSIRSTSAGAGFALLDRYGRDLPGVEKMAIHSRDFPISSFVNGVKVDSRVMYTDGPYWEILDFEFLEGGPFLQSDDDAGNLVAVISEATRKQFFDSPPALGRSIELDGRIHQVVGVVRNVDWTRDSARADIWAPHGSRKSHEYRQDYSQAFTGLLLTESSQRFAEIKSEFRSRMEHIDVPAGYDTIQVTGEPRTRLEMLAGPTDPTHESPVSPVATLAWGVAGGLLLWMLLPALNLININMSRIIERSSEIGVRKAFGASSRNLVGQFILENVILCVVGGLLALPCALLVRDLIQGSGVIPYLDVRLHFRTFVYALGLACLFGVLSGAIPAWRMSRMHPVQALRGGGR